MLTKVGSEVMTLGMREPDVSLVGEIASGLTESTGLRVEYLSAKTST
jgi:hypothetical protein